MLHRGLANSGHLHRPLGTSLNPRHLSSHLHATCIDSHDADLQHFAQRRLLLMTVASSCIATIPIHVLPSYAATTAFPPSPTPPPSPHKPELLQGFQCISARFTFRGTQCDVLTQQAGQNSSRGNKRQAVLSKPASCSDSGVGVVMHLYMPSGGPSPTSARRLLLLSPGFLVQSDAYASHIRAALDDGWCTATYDINQSATDALDDVEAVQVLKRVLDWAISQAGQDSPAILLVGHSRGAKTVSLAAQQMLQELPGYVQEEQYSNEQVPPAASRLAKTGTLDAAQKLVGLVLLDPADGSFETVEGARFPSATATPAHLATLVIGAGRNTDCVPRKANYHKFWKSARSTSMLVELKDSGHFTFLDYQTSLQQAVCSGGKADPAAVRSVTCLAMQLWGRWCIETLSMHKAASDDGRQAQGLNLGLVLPLQQRCEDLELNADFAVLS